MTSTIKINGIREIQCKYLDRTTGSNSSTAITAEIPVGYKFLCWLGATSVGWVGCVYPTMFQDATCTVWSEGANRRFWAFYLVYK